MCFLLHALIMRCLRQIIRCGCVGIVPDIRLSAAGTGYLVFSQVCVMRRRDVVVSQRSAHVLIHVSMVRVKHIILFREHVHGETVLGHE